MLQRMYKIFGEIDTSLSVIAVGLVGMFWFQESTKIDGISATIFRLFMQKWDGWHPIFCESGWTIMLSILYWIATILVIVFVFGFIITRIVMAIRRDKIISPEMEAINRLDQKLDKLIKEKKKHKRK